MTPLQRYQQDIAEHGFQRDEAQHNAVVALDNLYHAIAEFQSAPIPQLSTWQKLLGTIIVMMIRMSETARRRKVLEVVRS